MIALCYRNAVLLRPVILMLQSSRLLLAPDSLNRRIQVNPTFRSCIELVLCWKGISHLWSVVFCLYADVLIGSRNHTPRQRGQPLSHANVRQGFAYTC
jgi:hypothetical protein